MEHTWMMKYFAEFFGTLILVLFGNGAVANTFLTGTTGDPEDGKANGGWLLIALSFGFGVMIPSMLFGSISGCHINPAATIAQACAGIFPWSHVWQYILFQFLGAMCGQLIVLAVYWPHFKKTKNSHIVFSCFSTVDATNNKVNGFVAEAVGTAVLMFVAIGLYRGTFFKQAVDIANIGVGFMIMAVVMAIGGPTGPSLNPARDLGPRILYAILPVPNSDKNAHWDYGWIASVGPIVGAIIGIFLYKFAFGL